MVEHRGGEGRPAAADVRVLLPLLVILLLASCGAPDVPPPTASQGPPPVPVVRTRPTTTVVPCAPQARVCVRLSARHAWLRDGGRMMADGPAVFGPPDEPTPTGTFHVLRKDVDHVSGESGLPMHYAVFFDDHGRALHEGPMDKASAGCVHLDAATAPRFFAALQRGDMIQIVP